MRVRDKIDLYLDNINNCRKIGTDIDYSQLTDINLINTIKNYAGLRYSYLKEDNELLSEILYNLKIDEYDEEYIKDLEYFSNKTFDYSASIDSAIYLEINKKLLEYAKNINKDELIIKYTYNVALGLFYLNGSSQPISLKYKKEVAKLNSKIVEKYFDKFRQYDESTKFNLIRCYGNIKLGIPKDNEKDIRTITNICKDLINLCNNQEIRETNPDIPFDNIIYSTHFDFLSSLNYLRRKKINEYNDFEKKLAKYYLKSVMYLENKEKENLVDENRVQNWRLKYYGLAIRYHNGIKPINELLDFLMSDINSISLDDISPNAIRKIVVNCAHLLEYYNDANEMVKEEYKDKIDDILHKTFIYVELLRHRNYPQLVNYVFTILTIMQADEKKEDSIEILDSILFNHRPTYIHSLMVAFLAKTLTKYIISTDPSILIGTFDTKNVKEVLDKKEQIIDTIFKGGIYHDIGKTLVISYISNYERSLTDEEFNCVKEHTNFGYEILSKIGESDFAIIARYHHKAYDEVGGYPNCVDKCPSRLKTLVDIISIADSLDAASDFIGRSYKNYKKLDVIVDEFRNFSGTRYNPQIVKLFDDKVLFDEIEYLLTKERTKLYIETYKNRKYVLNK